MGEFSIWHWLVVLLVVMLLFGGGKVSGLMGDLAKGIKSFKAVMAEDDGKAKPAAAAAPAQPAAAAAPPVAVAQQSATPAAAKPAEKVDMEHAA
ncbi:MAG: twin-arginine translocase TatA/TatE family subunit [Acetobacteraceae bacterium]